MSIASEALIRSKLAKSKQILRDLILKEADTGVTYLRLDYLHCGDEYITEMINWLKSEQLRVKTERIKEKPTGFGTYDDDADEIERIFYQINW